MRVPVRLTADVVGAALLAAAAAVLLSTPYDGGACRNVAAAYALRPVSVPHAEPPDPPAALADARAAVSRVSSELAALSDDRAAVERAEAAATQARTAAREAQEKTWTASSPTTSTTMAELDVDMAASQVTSAESWLETVRAGAAEDPLYAAWTEQDVADAQGELDDARADLSSAEQALEAARSEAADSERAAAKAERDAEALAAAADTAEQAAESAAAALRTAELAGEERLEAAESRVDELEVEDEQAQATWSHEQRVERDRVVAVNNVRSSCREHGGWRAGVALTDIALLALLAARAWWPRSLRPSRLRLPRPLRLRR